MVKSNHDSVHNESSLADVDIESESSYELMNGFSESQRKGNEVHTSNQSQRVRTSSKKPQDSPRVKNILDDSLVEDALEIISATTPADILV